MNQYHSALPSGVYFRLLRSESPCVLLYEVTLQTRQRASIRLANLANKARFSPAPSFRVRVFRRHPLLSNTFSIVARRPFVSHAAYPAFGECNKMQTHIGTVGDDGGIGLVKVSVLRLRRREENVGLSFSR